MNKVLPTAVEQGLRELPYEMVCAFQDTSGAPGVVSYDGITVEFNNSDQPGGADGLMNIETGVFTAVTSGYYIVTFSCHINVLPEQTTVMYLYHNGAQVEESSYLLVTGTTSTDIGTDIHNAQGSRTVVSTLLVFNC